LNDVEAAILNGWAEETLSTDNHQPHRIASALAAYAVIGGVLALLGWWQNIQWLADWDRDGVAQQPNNALAIAAAGLAVILASSVKTWGARALGAVAGVIGAATLFEHATSVNLGIDTLLVEREWGQRGTMSPGRMGLPASVAIVIVSLSIFALTWPRVRRFAIAGGLVMISIATLSLIGYAFGADPLFAVPRLTTIAWQTSTMILALGASLVASVPERNPM
jgi:hypothetical protein